MAMFQRGTTRGRIAVATVTRDVLWRRCCLGLQSGGIPNCEESSDQFVARKKIAQFKCSRLRGVRAVGAIVSDAGAEVTANRARRSLGGISGAHCVAPLQNRALGFESKHD